MYIQLKYNSRDRISVIYSEKKKNDEIQSKNQNNSFIIVFCLSKRT